MNLLLCKVRTSASVQWCNYKGLFAFMRVTIWGPHLVIWHQINELEYIIKNFLKIAHWLLLECYLWPVFMETFQCISTCSFLLCYSDPLAASHMWMEKAHKECVMTLNISDILALLLGTCISFHGISECVIQLCVT